MEFMFAFKLTLLISGSRIPGNKGALLLPLPGLQFDSFLEEFAHFLREGEPGWFLYRRTCSSSIILKQRKANEKPVAYWIQLFTMCDVGREDREEAILTRK